MIDPTRTVGYYRVSTEKQADTSTVLARYREDLLNAGILEPNLYFDIQSGGDAQREGFNSVLRACRDWADTIALPDFSRFQRSMSIWESVRPELVRLNVRIIDIYSNLEIDFRTAEGIRNTQIETAQNEYFRNFAAQSCLRGQERRRRQRKPSVAPFGYLIVKDKLIINRNLYKDTGKTYEQIAKEYIELFIETKILCKTVSLFCEKYGHERIGHGAEDFPHDRSAFKRWLDNPALRGHQAYHHIGNIRRKSAFKNEHLEPRIYYNNHEPLIDNETANELDKILSLFQRGPVSTAPVNPLSGLMFCGCCGGKIRSKGETYKNKDYRYLFCSNAYPTPGKKQTCQRTGVKRLKVSQVVDATIDAIILKAKEIAEWGLTSLSVPESTEIKTLRESIIRLEKLNDPDLIEVIQEKRNRLKSFMDASTKEDYHRSEIELRLQGVCSQRDFWLSLSVAEQKGLFPEFVEKIVIENQNIKVILRV